jgi:hypothetical protein
MDANPQQDHELEGNVPELEPDSDSQYHSESEEGQEQQDGSELQGPLGSTSQQVRAALGGGIPTGITMGSSGCLD